MRGEGGEGLLTQYLFLLSKGIVVKRQEVPPPFLPSLLPSSLSFPFSWGSGRVLQHLGAVIFHFVLISNLYKTYGIELLYTLAP